VKSIDFYALYNDKFLFEEIDLTYFMYCLEQDQDEITDGFMIPKEEDIPKFVDPVIDPTQTWTEVFENIRKFKAPKMVIDRV